MSSSDFYKIVEGQFEPQAICWERQVAEQVALERFPFLRPDSAVGGLGAELVEDANAAANEFEEARQNMLENGEEKEIAESAYARIMSQHAAARLEIFGAMYHAVWTALDEAGDQKKQHASYETAVDHACQQQLSSIEDSPTRAHRFAVHRNDLKNLISELAVLYRIGSGCAILLDELPANRTRPTT